MSSNHHNNNEVGSGDHFHRSKLSHNFINAIKVNTFAPELTQGLWPPGASKLACCLVTLLSANAPERTGNVCDVLSGGLSSC